MLGEGHPGVVPQKVGLSSGAPHRPGQAAAPSLWRSLRQPLGPRIDQAFSFLCCCIQHAIAFCLKESGSKPPVVTYPSVPVPAAVSATPTELSFVLFHPLPRGLVIPPAMPLPPAHLPAAAGIAHAGRLGSAVASGPDGVA